MFLATYIETQIFKRLLHLLWSLDSRSKKSSQDTFKHPKLLCQSILSTMLVKDGLFQQFVIVWTIPIYLHELHVYNYFIL